MENSNNDGRTLPYSSDIEKAVVGGLLIESDAYSRVCDVLSTEVFYERKNQVIYEAIKNLHDNGEPCDMLSVVQFMLQNSTINVAGGAAYVAEVCTSVLSTAHLEHYSRILVDLATRRRLVTYGHEVEAKAYDESCDIEKLVASSTDELAGIVAGGKQKIFTLANTLTEIGEIIKHNAEEPDSINATPTGFPFLDAKGGLQETDFVVIAGSTSQGKTSFANSITLSAIKNGKKVAFYSLEMTREQLTARLLSRGSKIGSNRILNSILDANEQYRVNAERAELLKYGRNLFFDDASTSNIDKILASIRALKMRYDIHVVVLDYIQILNVNMRNMNKEQAMGDVARRLKNIAKDLRICVIALSQLNRDTQNPEPSLDRIRDSGQIAEASDITILVYRPEIYGKRYPKPFENVDTHGTAMIDVCKGRNVGIGKFICGFDADTTFFYPLKDIPTYKAPIKQEKKDDDIAPF